MDNGMMECGKLIRALERAADTLASLSVSQTEGFEAGPGFRPDRRLKDALVLIGEMGNRINTIREQASKSHEKLKRLLKGIPGSKYAPKAKGQKKTRSGNRDRITIDWNETTACTPSECF